MDGGFLLTFSLSSVTDNGPKITERVKTVMGEDYNYDSTNTLYALYRSFTECLFVEEESDIVFYKNKDGQAARGIAECAVRDIRKAGWDPVEQDRLGEGSQR
jgi:omega-6 fatty acid desaturase (delta-12 desaturase)